MKLLFICLILYQILVSTVNADMLVTLPTGCHQQEIKQNDTLICNQPQHYRCDKVANGYHDCGCSVPVSHVTEN